MQPLAVHRYSADAQRRDGEVGGPLHELRQQKLAHRHRKEQEAQGKSNGTRNLQPEQRRHRQHQQRRQRQLRECVDCRQLAQPPQQGRTGHGKEYRERRPGSHLHQLRSASPDQPQHDGRNHKCVGKGVRARPYGDHRQRGLPVQEQHPGQRQYQGETGASPGPGQFAGGQRR